MNEIVVVGGGGHAKVLIGVLKKSGFNVIGYLDLEDRGTIMGIRYYGTDKALTEIRIRHPHCTAAIGVGNVDISVQRREIRDQLVSHGYSLPAIVSPDAIVNESTTLGEGTVVFDGVVVNPGARIGQCVILNTNSTVEHDCILGDFVHIAPGAILSGEVVIGDGSMIGAGASVIQGRKVGKDCMIGAGSTVLSDCLVSGTYIGSPARKAK
jgi:UDP-perosamine 4-acetyltransferase